MLSNENCFSDTINKKYVLGHIDLYTALPISDQPDNAYREVYRKCIIKLLNQSKTGLKNAEQMSAIGDAVFKNADLAMRLRFPGFTKLAAAVISASPNENVFSAIQKMKWTDLKEEQQLSIIKDQMLFILGPNLNHIPAEIDLDKSILKSVNRVAAKDGNGDLISASYFSLYYIFNSDSFLVY